METKDRISVNILIVALEQIAIWGDTQEEQWDDPGDCALDAIQKYRYSLNK